MRRMKSSLVAIGAVSTLMAVAEPADLRHQQSRANEFVVVVNVANPLTSIARDQLSRIFLKRVAKWPDGKPAEPVDLSPNDRLRVAFTKSVHGKSVGAVRAFWQQQIFSGRDVPPPEKASVAEVIDFVGTHPGAVGYVPFGQALGSSVKSVPIEGEAP
jgi:ABC-type phosphate transport system substrate-binding protein